MMRTLQSGNQSGEDNREWYLPRTVAEWREVSQFGRKNDQTNGPVVITVFADYQCRACAQFHDVLQTVAAETRDVITVRKAHYPLSSNPHSVVASNAAECAAEQGGFEAFEDALYSQQDSIGEASWEFFATLAMIEDTTAFNACMASMRHLPTVRDHQLMGRRLRIVGTPSYLVNDVLYVGSGSKTVLMHQVHEAAERFRERPTTF